MTYTAWRSPVHDEIHVTFIIRDEVAQETAAFTVETWTLPAKQWNRQVVNWRPGTEVDLAEVDAAVSRLIASEQKRCPCGSREFNESDQCTLCTVASFGGRA